MLTIFLVSVVLVAGPDPRRTTKTTTVSDTDEESTTEGIGDINFDLALRAQLRAYRYRDEEPAFAKQTQFLDKNVEDWSFAYEGGEFKDKRPPFSKAVTWAIGLIGIDYFEKTYKVTGMGALVNPQIVMTLCASINSYYRSYKGLLFEEQATDELFHVSNTSDPQFDIRTPTIIAYWSSKEGFIRKTGEERLMEVSRHILATEKCTHAVEGKHINQTIQQYVTPAFLLLRERISNPFGSDLSGYLANFLDKLDDDSITDEYRKRDKGFPIEMMAYKQRACHYAPNITKLTSLKVWREPQTGEIVEAGLHLLNTRWDESSVDKQTGKLEPWEIHSLKSCSFFDLQKFREADEAFNTNTQQPVAWAKEFKIAMAEAFKKPQVACLEWFWGNLCDAPPGSPVFYWSRRTDAHPGTDTMIALTITSPKTLQYAKADKSVHMMVMMVTQEAGKKLLIKEIKDLIEYVKNLGKTREQATDYPTYNRLVEDEKIRLELTGNLDGDLVPVLEERLYREGIVLSIAVRTELAQFVVPATLILVFLMYFLSL